MQFKEVDTGRIMTYDEMVEYCTENYDYGDPTNLITYLEYWYREYGFIRIN